MKIFIRYIKRVLIIAGAFIIVVLPVLISNTFSNTDYTLSVDSTVWNDNLPVSPGINEYEPVQAETLGHTEQTSVIYPSDITETENNYIRQIIKTYELSVFESPDSIPKETFDNGGWRYEFTDITKKLESDNATKEYSVTINIDSNTKEIDDIISQLVPTLLYTSQDGYSGLLSLDISSIVVEIADEPGFDSEIETDTEISAEPDTEASDYIPMYHTTANYTGTLSKLLIEQFYGVNSIDGLPVVKN